MSTSNSRRFPVTVTYLPVTRCQICHLTDEAFDQGRLAALDELQDRFCVCMK